MARSALAIALIICNLLAISTGVAATCEACPNCVYQEISPTQGNECLDNWTCSGDTITCNYPSATNPGTFTACAYSASAMWGLVSGPSDICPGAAGDNSKCEPPNNPYIVDYACTASYGYVGEDTYRV